MKRRSKKYRRNVNVIGESNEENVFVQDDESNTSVQSKDLKYIENEGKLICCYSNYTY